MHATTVKNKITQRDNYKEIMSVIVVVLLLTLTLIAIFSAIDQLGISEMGRMVSKEYRCQRHTGMNTDNTMNALAI
ncbi:two-component system connector SafA [Escherichia coli]|uniref:two-component system connector SafA n=1 Tax=Escherichia coli TaxID=562 RepID=UPI0010CB3605|nr:two-component system connector SafA [Escherichia coli]GDK35846.1 two-component system connector membrane protein [Escherichia coli]